MKKNKFSYGLTLGALGVVFGDIGTSPLYALGITLGSIHFTTADILGVLSLIFWTLAVVISIKYLLVIFRADNQGEGGILALLALLMQKNTKYEKIFYLIAILGSGLILGDGMLTPAISVISAVEGLGTISESFNDWVLPLSCVILFFIFVVQSKGSGTLGKVFGPLILLWFITLAVLGVYNIIYYPLVLKALNPYHALHFLSHSGLHGYLLLGGIFLVVTGGEALYADMGHFGKGPIRYSWFAVVFPSLVLNYFGQGAYLIQHPEAINGLFFKMAPSWSSIPLVLIAAIATIIASQAVIAATFSLARQAVLLGLCPRIPIIHTSKHHQGQIYVPQVNTILLIGTFFLVFWFKSSSNLAHAYGIAVNLNMLLITTMVAYTALTVWQWSRLRVVLIFGIFLTIDFAFLGANAHKFTTGGWIPVFFACIVAFIMYTWTVGLEYLRNNFYLKKEEISKILTQLNYKSFNHLKGVTSIFITDVYDKSGGSFLHFLKFSMAVPENILLVNYAVKNIPHVVESERYALKILNDKVCSLSLSYGFMDQVSIPDALDGALKKNILPFSIDVYTASYIVEVPNIVASRNQKSLSFYMQEKLFSFLMRNYSANLNIEFYNLPYNKTMAIGSYCIL